MVKSIQPKSGAMKFTDESKDLDANTLSLVLAAMTAGLREFTTPTPEDGEGRLDWKVRNWLTMRDENPVCFLVAYQELAPHFEVVGPEVPLKGKQ